MAAAGDGGGAKGRLPKRGLTGAGRDFPFQPISKAVVLDIKVVLSLQIEPETLR